MSEANQIFTDESENDKLQKILENLTSKSGMSNITI